MKYDNRILSKTLVCEKELCNGCYACESICPYGAISVKDMVQYFYSEIDKEKCINCGLCFSTCPNHTEGELKKPTSWYQGWAENEVRSQSSSGGLAYKLSEAFIESGGYVCACVFEKGEFIFKIYSEVKLLHEIQGSKYVKSNPKSVYKDIKDLLTRGEKVLYIALPCQVAAMKAFVGKKIQKNLYTIDLICHGSPSSKVLYKFLEDKGIDQNKINSISFRNKNSFGVKVDNNDLATYIPDKYTTAFMEGLCYTENCYTCDFAKQERISDITLGDSWGSSLFEEVKKGISLLLCMSEKGEELVGMIPNILLEVDIVKAVNSNRQLNSPSVKPPKYQKFFELLLNNKSFSQVVFQCCYKTCIKQNIKQMLIKIHVLRGDR